MVASEPIFISIRRRRDDQHPGRPGCAISQRPRPIIEAAPIAPHSGKFIDVVAGRRDVRFGDVDPARHRARSAAVAQQFVDDVAAVRGVSGWLAGKLLGALFRARAARSATVPLAARC
jgi:hypothetical protein